MVVGAAETNPAQSAAGTQPYAHRPRRAIRRGLFQQHHRKSNALECGIDRSASRSVRSFAVRADDTPLDIKADLRGQFFVVEKDDDDDKPTLLVKAVAGNCTRYLKRELDCVARTVRYLGRGESLEEVAAARPDAKAYLIVAGTIADQLARLVCPRKSGEGPASGHGASAIPENVSRWRHDRFPYPDPLPEGEGGRGARFARLS